MLPTFSNPVRSAAAASAIAAFAFATPAAAEPVTNEIIFGSGNANGSFTLDTATVGGDLIELGLRAKVRYDPVDNQPKNIFNWDGVDTYFMPIGGFDHDGNPVTPDRARWNFEWSINVDASEPVGTTPITDYWYQLSVTDNTPLPTGDFAYDPIGNNSATPPLFIPFNYYGNNTTANGTGTLGQLPVADVNNLGQQSVNLAFLPVSPLYDYDAIGDYEITLSIFDTEANANNNTNALASTSITVVVPEPGTIALAALGGLALMSPRRRRQA